jgi:hypothetical protein
MCLKSMVWLLERLELKVPDESSGEDHMHDIARLFNRYYQSLLTGLEMCRPDLLVSPET